MTNNVYDLHAILSRWPDADLTKIKSVEYFDGWSSHEEDAGCLIYMDHSDDIFIQYYSHYVMIDDYDEPNNWNPTKISMEDALQEIEYYESATDSIRT